jgi:hypothetical protein
MTANQNYTVWVGGSEVNDEYLSQQDAVALAQHWRAQGYNDVAVELVDTVGNNTNAQETT